MLNTNRNEVSRLAQAIENLAKQVQDKLSQGSDPIAVANELVRNSSIFVFALGEMHALEGNKTVKGTAVGNSRKNYHNVRDAFGRFKRA